MIRLFSIILIALAISGCSHLKYVTRDFCELAPDGQVSRKDTLGTQRWMDAYREKYRRRCPGDQYKW